MTETQENIYIQRVNCVLDYIATHLEDDLTLSTLAGVAGFSDFHFHRVFKAVVGETINQFVWRVRLERGALLLRANPNTQVSDAAIDCGFTSLAGFSRAFKKRFGISPTQWDRQTRLLDEPSNGSAFHVNALHTSDEQFVIQLRHMPAQRLAYMRVHDSYSDPSRIEIAYNRLLNWYQARGGSLNDTTLYGMSQDDPDITPAKLCRFDWCLHIPDDWSGDEDISVRDFPACTLAVIEMNGSLALEERVWHYFWRDWLPRSRYQPDNLPAMEIYRRFPHEAGWWDRFYLDCALPITQL